MLKLVKKVCFQFGFKNVNVASQLNRVWKFVPPHRGRNAVGTGSEDFSF
jgi:hypothetical protein